MYPLTWTLIHLAGATAETGAVLVAPKVTWLDNGQQWKVPSHGDTRKYLTLVTVTVLVCVVEMLVNLMH